ncbi:nuclear transport factor 2 family protein [Hymenobacter sp. BT770]|uniref:nuclear transport factor 2 family protein n=1 Tax=Hymenobacter sp. BT770 TaxID=2886942 RepID=UPI001D114CD0|nr:nuclear transport factor 2 family protein [Hymenobacter sp. BT770]MCC3153062.1 nuclear transport factor 2 family protein [Hymenobacter sp. BT770]MDO3415025.1 nuclear transport factor 2 family protein [Hymenobacter sp. BT770]
MKHFFALLLSAAATSSAFAQKASSETAAVKQTVTSFFDGMRRGDSTMVRRTLAPGVVFHGIGGKPGQPSTLETESINGFLKAVGTPHPEIWDERVQFERVLIDANLASVWAPYEFYLGSKFSHCGYDSFQLVKLADGWKIAHIIDTRRKEKCK